VKVAVAMQTEERSPSRTDAELPRDVRGRLASRADDAAVNRAQMIPGADLIRLSRALSPPRERKTMW